MNVYQIFGLIGSLITAFLLLPDLIYYIRTKTIKHTSLLEIVIYWVTIFAASGITIMQFILGNYVDASLFCLWVSICIVLSLPLIIANIKAHIKKGGKHV